MHDQMRRDVEALLGIKGNPGMVVITEKLKNMTAAQSEHVPLKEENWALKVAHRNGYVDALNDLSKWLNGAMSARIDSSGAVRRRQP